jgi:hypothetical protein
MHYKYLQKKNYVGANYILAIMIKLCVLLDMIQRNSLELLFSSNHSIYNQSLKGSYFVSFHFN